ncbi:MAG TPA: signal peptidase I [Chitinophagales bacterium]|nr:signal peptidase I [Chitinophagales bacterium]
MKKKSVIWEWVKAILFAAITIILFRVFFFEAYTIPSSSMEKSLLCGDYILVSKVSYGSRVPNTPLSIPFVHQQIPFTENRKSYSEWIKFPYFRLFGSPAVEHGDVVVFNWPMEDDFPVDQRTFYIKRCVGIAGDTLQIREGQVYINGHYNDLPKKLQFNYKITTDGDTLNVDSLSALHIYDGGKMNEKGEYWYTLGTDDIDRMKSMPHVLKIAPLLEKKGAYSDYMFPENEHFLWNVDFFGPVYIPKSGDSVKLSIDSLPLYDRIISTYEKNELRVSHDSIFINNKYATHYTFKMNYFFMMGDNRHNSADSRFWGFVPEDHIVGKTLLVLLSIDKKKDGTGGKIRKDRWFKPVY